MQTRTTLSTSEARKKIFQITDEVVRLKTYYTLTEHGKPKAVILSAQEFESLIETLEVMQDFSNFEDDFADAKKEIAEGRYTTYVPTHTVAARSKRSRRVKSKQ